MQAASADAQAGTEKRSAAPRACKAPGRVQETRGTLFLRVNWYEMPKIGPSHMLWDGRDAPPCPTVVVSGFMEFTPSWFISAT